MLQLSAFADEISPELDEQIAVCGETGVTHFELRSVNGINVLEFEPARCSEIRSKLRDAGIGVICIGSPIGKVPLDEPWQPYLERYKIAVERAEFFGAPLIRLFSYYGTKSDSRNAVLDRFRAKIDYLGDRPITLVHENESGIFGDTGARCADLLGSINSPKLRCAFDFANFVQCQENPRDNWPLLKPFTTHFHVKDALKADGKVVPAGEGDGQLAPILADAHASGYRGFLSLEPHLKVAGKSHGETGPELFRTAVKALRKVCAGASIPLAT